MPIVLGDLEIHEFEIEDADNDDEYGIGPKARKALDALAAHKET